MIAKKNINGIIAWLVNIKGLNRGLAQQDFSFTLYNNKPTSPAHQTATKPIFPKTATPPSSPRFTKPTQPILSMEFQK
jgi:hypothetical protein